MKSHNSPVGTAFPIQVDSLEQFQTILDSFKHKLFLVLTSVEPISASSSIKILETKTYKIGKLTLKRTEKTITDPEELPNLVFNPDEYTIEDLWAVLAKQGKLRKLRMLLMGRKVKGSLAMSVMRNMNRGSKKRTIINKEDTAKWLTIRKVVFDKLTEKQKDEWGLLSGLMVVSKGGRLLGHGQDKKRTEVKGEEPQLRGVPTTSNRLATRPVISISKACAHSAGRTDEYPERPGNFPRVRPPSTFTIEALASLEQRVRQLEIRSQFTGTEWTQSLEPTGRSCGQAPKHLATNSPHDGSWAGNHEALSKGPRSGILGFEGYESSESGCESEGSEDGDELYEDNMEEQVETRSLPDHRVSMFCNTSTGSDIRNECMSPVDWVAFAAER